MRIRGRGGLSVRNRVGLVVSFVWLSASVNPSLARSAGARRLGVANFHGPAGSATRNIVTRAAQANHYQVIGGDQLERTAAKLRVRLDSDRGFGEVARSLGISAFLTGEMTTGRATLTIRNGDGGAVLDVATWTAPNPSRLSAMVAKTFWRRLGPSIERSRPPAGVKAEGAVEAATAAPGAARAGAVTAVARAPAPTTAPTTAPLTADASAETAAEPDLVAPQPSRPPAVEEPGESINEVVSVSVGPRLGMRSLSYTEDRYAMNSNYSLANAPLAGVAVDIFPGALTSTGAAAAIGMTGDVSYLLPVVKSQFQEGGPSYTTSGVAWSVGVKVRAHPGVFGTAAVGSHYYRVADTSAGVPSNIPTTNYQFIRAGAGLRRRLSPAVVLMARGAYLYCLKLGQIADAGYFPKATGAGFEAGTALGFQISSRLEARLGIDVQRFKLAFNVTQADYLNGARTAGGAVDQYVEVWAALAFVMGGLPVSASISQ